jgi:hypothetical protein
LDGTDASCVLNTLVAGTDYSLSIEKAAEAFDVILALQQQRQITLLDVVHGVAQIPVLDHFTAEVRRAFVP